jgi:hypothetical protein
MANFKTNTRYTNGRVAKNRTGKDFLVLRKNLFLQEASTDTLVVVTQEYLNRPDLLSSKVYGTPDLWWAIYEFNNIRDPLFDLRMGQILRIPNIDRLLQAIADIGN